MKLNETTKIKGIVSKEIEDIQRYFSNLQHESLDYIEFSRLVKNEIDTRSKRLMSVVEETTIAYLKSDAMDCISSWTNREKNLFYESKIEEKIFRNISIEEYKTNDSRALEYTLQGAIIFLSGLTMWSYTSYSTILRFLIFVALLLVSKYLSIQVISPLKKHYERKGVEKYLEELKKILLDSSSSIVKEYSQAFDEFCSKQSEGKNE